MQSKPAPKVSERPKAAAKAVPIDTFRAQKEIKSLACSSRSSISGKTLTHTEMETITYFYDTLHMSADLIEYLLETCVENGHKSMHYIQKVAFSWAEAGVETVAQAREQSAHLQPQLLHSPQRVRNQEPRARPSSELDIYKESGQRNTASHPDIIEEACRRTISATHQPKLSNMQIRS